MCHVAMLAVAILTTLPGQTNDPAVNRTAVELKLTDGSLIRGFCTGEAKTLNVASAVGQFSLADSTADRFKIDGDHVVLSWNGGDRLTVTPAFTTVQLKTVLGSLDVPLSAIKSGSIKQVAPPEPLAPVAVRVSGQYAHHKTEYAYDGNRGMSWSSGDWKGWIEFDLGESHDLGAIVTSLQFAPAGNAVYEVYVSQEPIGTSYSSARMLKRIEGHRNNHDLLIVDCPVDANARYVQVRCLSSRAWFNVRELEVYPR